MSENIYETQYDVTKKNKLRVYYESNKFLIYAIFFLLLIILGGGTFYLDNKNKKSLLVSEDYIQAKVYLENNRKDEAKNKLKKIVLSNDPSYSTLSFFMILNQKLINDKNEILMLFNHLLENNKYDTEIKNLLIFKKALYNSNFILEIELLEELKPLLNEETIWKAHALMLLGDYFSSKKEDLKAKDFYTQVLLMENLHKDLYEQAKYKISLSYND